MASARTPDSSRPLVLLDDGRMAVPGSDAMSDEARPGPDIDPTAIDDAAQDWFLLLRSSAADDAMRRRFQAWFEADPRHAAAYREVAALWSDIGDLENAFAAAPAVPERRRYAVLSGRAWRKPVLWFGTGLAAACVALAMFLAPPLLVSLTADHVTAAGEQQRIDLPDGSVAWLNTDTAIEVRYRAEERLVELLKGEAQFEVRRDLGRPFSVLAADGRSTALGTVYGVRLADGGAIVSVVEGRVQVRSPADEPTGGDPRHQAVLTAGQAVAYGEGAPPGPVETARRNAVAWREGHIAIDDLPLAEALSEIDRYHPGRIVTLSDLSDADHVTGRLSIRDLDAGLDALAAAQGLSLIRISDYLVLVR